MFQIKIISGFIEKNIKFLIFLFFNGSAAPEDIIQMTSDHVGMLIRTWTNILRYGYVNIQYLFHSTLQCAYDIVHMNDCAYD